MEGSSTQHRRIAGLIRPRAGSAKHLRVSPASPQGIANSGSKK